MMNRFLGAACAALAALCVAGPVHAQSKSGTAQPAEAPTSGATPAAVGLGPCRNVDDDPANGCFPAEALGVGPQPSGRYLHSRWAEDWSFLRDPKKRQSPFDRLKYLPLSDDGGIYLTLSGQERFRYNVISAAGLKEGPTRQQILSRTVLGADLHVGPHLRFFAEVETGQFLGANKGPTSGKLEDHALLNQGFVDLTAPLAGGMAGVRFGRQEFSDGPPLLISTRDSSNLRLTQNGVRSWIDWPGVRVQVIDFLTTTLGTGGFADDTANQDERLRGANASIVLKRAGNGSHNRLYLDPFVYDYYHFGQVWGGIAGTERRTSFGARLWGTVGPLSLDWTIARQTGSFLTPTRDAAIDALGIRAIQSVRLADGVARPEIGFRADYGSGGGAYANSGALHSFNWIYGGSPYYSYGAFLNPANLTILSPTFAVSPVRKVRITLEYDMLWRSNDQDAVYSSSGATYAGTQAVPGSRVGQMPRMLIDWTPVPQVNLQLQVEWLEAGPVLRNAGYASTIFVGPLVNLRF
jgi:hypothetical protein